MGITRMMDSIIGFLSEAVARIFSLNDNEYPLTGVQPFEGDPYEKPANSDW